MLILDNPNTYSKEILDQLKATDVMELLKNRTSIEQIQRKKPIIELFEEIESYARKNGVVGFHCTKEIPSKPYIKNGLRILNMQSHHLEFIENISQELKNTDEEIYNIKNKLTDFRNQDTGRRDGLIWFCLNRNLVNSRGTEGFFEYYGGEAINFWYRKDPIIGPLCKKIGNPVIVEAIIEYSRLTLYLEYGLGKCLISCYANSINNNFIITDLQGHSKSNISSMNIRKVHPRESFL
ncbi:hypothetical protein JWG44_21805 [Leptospira sp. 201903071]|uniref:hypothetical protein n=1 Tax=Leptospira ainazelensis TaxID=2810034 RepID=UPI0019639F65|nr:hypothetical protein [Leptospira ainazelensis]MBM9502891.1 hypothetical protein [Leptospira ainazelensis]